MCVTHAWTCVTVHDREVVRGVIRCDRQCSVIYKFVLPRRAQASLLTSGSSRMKSGMPMVGGCSTHTHTQQQRSFVVSVEFRKGLACSTTLKVTD